MGWLISLSKERVAPEVWEYEAAELVKYDADDRESTMSAVKLELITKRQASSMIDAMKAAPKKAKESAAPKVVLEDGMYRLNGVIFKVYHTVHGANQQVAKKLVVTREGTPLAEPFTNDRGDYVYWEIEPEAEFVYQGKNGLKGLLPEHKLTLEAAKEFGHVYGVCGRCSRTLTREESIERGIGPVCWGKMEEGL